MGSKSQCMTIASLANELLLCIFDNLTPSALLRCALSCKRWSHLALSLLYQHTAFTPKSFSKWMKTPSDVRDARTKTFTLYIDCAISNPSQRDIDAFRQLHDDLLKLPSRLAKMTGLQSFSISTPHSAFSNLWLPSRLVGPILDQLPITCTCLEVDCMSTSYEHYPDSVDKVHLCPSIRRLLPQLRFLRLVLPEICPEAFGHGFAARSPMDHGSFRPTRALIIEEYVIRVAQSNNTLSAFNQSKICNCPDAHLVTTLVKYLGILKSSENAPGLRRLWLLDVKEYERLSWLANGAWIRRDVLKEISQVIPSHNLIQREFRKCTKYKKRGFFIRMPEDEGGKDLITTREGITLLTERYAWVQAINGTRVPSSYFFRTHLKLDIPKMVTGMEWRTVTGVTHRLWRDEMETDCCCLEVWEKGLTWERGIGWN